MPTSPENMTNALGSNYEFWVDQDTELNERFNAWLASTETDLRSEASRASDPDLTARRIEWRI